MLDRKIILDVETTGLYPAGGHKIVEIAAMELFNDKNLGKEFHMYIDPERNIPEEVIRVHGISNEKIKGSPIFADIADDLIEFIGDSKIIAHNSEFDRGFINHELSLCQKESLPKSSFIDSLVLAKEKFPNQKISLDELCKKFNISLETRKDHHGALIDIKLLAEVYYNLIKGQKNIFEEDAFLNTNKKTSNLNTNYDSIGLKQVSFTKRSFPLSEEEEQIHIDFINKMKKSLWCERISK